MPDSEGVSALFRQRLSKAFDGTKKWIVADDIDVDPTTISRWLSDKSPRGPGIFRVKRAADRLGVSVGYLLGETDDAITLTDRQRVAEMVNWLSDRFALKEHEPVHTLPKSTEEFPVEPDDFIETDFDYPRELHITRWREDFEVAAGEAGGTETDMTAHTIHSEDVRDTTHRVIKVRGRSMSPDYEEGWMLLVDLRKLQPQPGDPVAVYVEGRGSILGYWEPTPDGGALLEKANPESKPVRLAGDRKAWRLLGTVQKIVDQPAKRRKR
jgi:transcriptional regulator with XRE-family HTH domain